VIVFLDTSVLLAASGSVDGASAIIVRSASLWDLVLLTSDYAVEEVERNLTKLGAAAVGRWPEVKSRVRVVTDLFAFDRVSVFFPAKDRPILYTAANTSDVLLTLDRRDFMDQIGHSFYELRIEAPGDFLKRFENRPT
jgi:predicted nucleic acid-binding protein